MKSIYIYIYITIKINTTYLNTKILKTKIFHKLNIHINTNTYIILYTYTIIKLIYQNHTSTFHNQKSKQSSEPQTII